MGGYPMDSLILKGIQFVGHHGVSKEEREAGGRFSVDVTLSLNLSTAGHSDSLKDTVSYSEVNQVVLNIGIQNRYHLIETLAENIASSLLKTFPPVQEVDVQVRKLSPWVPGFLDFVAVHLHRSRNNS